METIKDILAVIGLFSLAGWVAWKIRAGKKADVELISLKYLAAPNRRRIIAELELTADLYNYSPNPVSLMEVRTEGEGDYQGPVWEDFFDKNVLAPHKHFTVPVYFTQRIGLVKALVFRFAGGRELAVKGEMLDSLNEMIGKIGTCRPTIKDSRRPI
jgi:hypothetical protein